MEAGEFYSFWFTIVSIERCRRMCKMNSIRFNNEKIKFPTCLPALGALVKLIAQTALVEEQVPFIATGKTIERERERESPASSRRSFLARKSTEFPVANELACKQRSSLLNLIWKECVCKIFAVNCLLLLQIN